MERFHINSCQRLALESFPTRCKINPLMERPAARGGDFTDVDAHDAQALIAYLDVATDLGQRDKLASYRAQGIAAGMSVLDIGCGTGDDVRAIAALVGTEGHAEGIDPSIAMIEEAHKRGVPPNASFSVQSGEAMDCAAESFDACRAERVFQHLTDPNAAAREIYRVTKRGGSALLLDQDWDTLVVAGAKREHSRRIARAYASRLAHANAGSDHRSYLRAAGFERIVTTALVATPNLTTAFAQFLNAAVDYALEDGAITADDAHAWLLALMQAEATETFVCALTVFVTLARKDRN